MDVLSRCPKQASGIAAPRAARLRLADAGGAFRLTIEPLQIGRTYRLQQSDDLMQWEDVTNYFAIQPAWDTLVTSGARACFYRVTSED